MYVTRPLSLFKNKGSKAAELPPPEGPHSGYLIQQEKEHNKKPTSFFRPYDDPIYATRLPFSQNRMFTVHYLAINGETATIFDDEVFFVPVPDQPLSANLYFVVPAGGSHAGEICTCSRKQDRLKVWCCFVVNDASPRPFREGDVYQQVRVASAGRKGDFYAKATAKDGILPKFVRRNGWELRANSPDSFLLSMGPASGVDRAPREKKPEAGSSAALVVGKWYTPFFFLREGELSPTFQMWGSFYYKVALEQFWEVIFARENSSKERSRRVEVRATVRTHSAVLAGRKPAGEIVPQPDGSAAFRPSESRSGGVILSKCLMERMEWEQARGGWSRGEGGVAVVEREEEYLGNGDWSSFKCFVLVERFSFRRLNSSLVIALDFRHTDKIITKWE